jgi:hypothetical protein
VEYISDVAMAEDVTDDNRTCATSILPIGMNGGPPEAPRVSEKAV